MKNNFINISLILEYKLIIIVFIDIISLDNYKYIDQARGIIQVIIIFNKQIHVILKKICKKFIPIKKIYPTIEISINIFLKIQLLYIYN